MANSHKSSFCGWLSSAFDLKFNIRCGVRIPSRYIPAELLIIKIKSLIMYKFQNNELNSSD
jgi:hypothetical protein